MMRVRAFLARRPLAAVTSTCVFLLCLLCGVLLVSASRESSGASHLVPGQAQQSHAERSIAEGGQGGESEMEQVRRRMQEEKVIIREDDIESTDAPLSSSSSSTTSSRPIQIDDIEACTPQPYNFGSYSYCGANFYDSSSYPVPTPVAGSTWNLVQLQLITRHGDRTPVNILPVYDVAYPFCDTTQSLGFYGTLASSAGEMGHTTKASQKQQHNRHHPRRRVASQQEGRRLERIPYLAEPSVSNPYASQLWEGSCMTGQLTSQGVQQLEEIGRAFRTVYVDQLGFLPSTYSRANTSFYLRTTDVWRTRQSAESLLTGLWPASDLESDVIPLHSFPAEIETMYANPTACDAVASVELQQYASDAWKAHLDAPEIWKELDSVLGVGDLPDWHLAYDHYVDNFRTRECHNLPLPCQAGNTSHCISPATANFVYGQGDWEYQYLMNESPLATDLAQYGISAFMSVIRDVIVGTITGNSSVSTIGTPQFSYYSGHDTTIGAVLGFLNVTGFQWPPYASNMQFELWQAVPTVTGDRAEDAPAPSAGPYSVRVLYNGAILPLYAAGCCDTLCPVEDFLAYFDAMIPENLVQICKGDGVRKVLKR